MFWRSIVIAVYFFAAAVGAFATDFIQEHRRPIPNPTLYRGTIEKYYLNGLMVHTYESREAQGNGSIIFENDTHLVLLEPQSMPESSRDIGLYLGSLGKPLAGVLVSYHGVGPDSFPGVPIYATPEAIAFIKSGKVEQALREFANTVDGADPKVVIPTNALTDPEFSIGGIDFKIQPKDFASHAGPGVDVGFPANCFSLPAYKMYYLHMLCADTHFLLRSVDDIDPYIAYLENLKLGGYEIFLCAHHRPETLADLDLKIAYLRTVKMLAHLAGTRDEFILELKRLFPTMKGDEFLNKTAANLYK